MSLLDQSLILDLQVLNLGLSLCQLDGNLVPLILGCLILCQQDILVHLDLLLPLLHGHLHLVLLVLEGVDDVGGLGEDLVDLLDLEFHDVVLHKDFLFLFGDFGQVLVCHLVLQC